MFLLVVRILMIFGFLSVMYIALVAYQRWDTRRTLESEHAAGAEPSLSREDYVARGLVRYERSFSRRALYAVFLLPVAIGSILAVLAILSQA